MAAIIQTFRLDLIPMPPAVLRSLLDGKLEEAGTLLGLTGTAAMDLSRYVLELRMGQLETAPGFQPWSLRAMVLRNEGIAIGHIGFHTAPGAEYLQELSPGGVELGYSVLEPSRRQGVATEAIGSLICWAQEVHGVTRFVLSISPENGPSLALAAKLGFHRIGCHMDEIDGPEDIFEKQYEPCLPE